MKEISSVSSIEKELSAYNSELALLRKSVASSGVSLISKNPVKRIGEKICKKILIVVCKDFFNALDCFQERIFKILAVNEETIVMQEDEIVMVKQLLEQKQQYIDSLETKVDDLTKRLEALEKNQ